MAAPDYLPPLPPPTSPLSPSFPSSSIPVLNPSSPPLASAFTDPRVGRDDIPSRSRSRTFSEAERDRHDEARNQSHSPVREGQSHPSEMNGEITANELRAEMETLYSLRRRSLSQPHAAVDPDLPDSPSPTPGRPVGLSITITPSPPGEGNNPATEILHPDSPTTPAPAETGTLIRRRSSASNKRPSEHPLPPLPPLSPNLHSIASDTSPSSSSLSASIYPSDSPHTTASTSAPTQELFWLPASLHPELAPQEFKAFIREQTRPEALARRTSLGANDASSSSSSATGGKARVDRKKSMLRGEYKPRKDDGVGDAPDGGDGVVRSPSGRVVGPGSRLNFEELTINDLQKLEELAARADSEGSSNGEGEGERLGRVLRRSLSLNPNLVAAAAAVGAHLPPLSDELSPLSPSSPTSPHPNSDLLTATDSDQPIDSPLIVPPPGQILRRSARTKIRKAGLDGDGGGHRFGPSRRSTRNVSGSSDGHAYGGLGLDTADGGEMSFEAGDALGEGKTVSPPESLESGEGVMEEDTTSASKWRRRSQQRRPTSGPLDDLDVQHLEVASVTPTSSTFTDTKDKDVEAPLPRVPARESAIPLLPPPSPPIPSSAVFSTPPVSLPAASSPEFDWATHQAQTALSPLPAASIVQPLLNNNTNNKAFTHPPSAILRTPPSPPPPSRPQATPPSPSRGGREKEGKKSGWAKLGFSSSSSKASAAAAEEERKRAKGKEREKDLASERERVAAVEKADTDRLRGEKEQRERDKEKETGFFGGLFGSGRKKGDQQDRDALAAQAYASAPSPQRQASPELRAAPPPTASGALLPDGTYTNFYRLPIHVERAVYRLSHIKLANPRRPLYEQVLISNLMFWYLSIINKPVAPVPVAAPVPVPQRASEQPSPNEADQSIQQPQPQTQPAQQQPKRMGLQKAGSRQPGRSAERPVQQPQYEQQGREIDQEYHHRASEHHTLPHQQSQNTPPPSHQHQQQQHHSTPPLSSRPSMPPRVSSDSVPYSTPETDHLESSSLPLEDGGPKRPTVSTRDSFPPRPINVPYKQHNSGFEVTSRAPKDHDAVPFPSMSRGDALDEQQQSSRPRSHRRKSSIEPHAEEVSIIDAYGQESPSSSPSSSPTLVMSEWKEKPPLLGAVTPRRRGDSLNARVDDGDGPPAVSGGYHTVSAAVELAPTYSSSALTPIDLDQKVKTPLAAGRQALGRRPQQ